MRPQPPIPDAVSRLAHPTALVEVTVNGGCHRGQDAPPGRGAGEHAEDHQWPGAGGIAPAAMAAAKYRMVTGFRRPMAQVVM